MTKKQFATRKATLLLLHSEQSLSTNISLSDPTSQLQFGNSRGVHLLVKFTAGGAASFRRQHGCHATFCSVSTVSVAPSTPNDSCGNRKNSDAIGRDGSEGHADGHPSASASLERLPVAIKKGDQLLPYVWDGRRMTAMSEAALQDSDVRTGRLRNWLQGLQRQLKDAFLPDPRDVTPDYWEWLRWRLTQRFFSSTMQNFSFSALLMATGLGAKKAFAASAAINWLLKDGVSRIVRMSVSTSFGQTFDADLKRMRFITSLIFTACMAGEFVTPFWPQHFVALASVSSVGRAVGLSAFVATQPAFQAALATSGNLADLTSKNQAQHMVMDMLALSVSAGLTWLCRGMVRGGLLLPAIMYPICAAGDLTCIWHELKAVQLRSLNRERAEMVIERWMQRGKVPDAAEVSAAESLVLPSDIWRGLLPLRITPLDRVITPSSPEQLRDLLREYESEQYVLHVVGRRGAAAAAAASTSGGTSGAQSGWQLPSWVWGLDLLSSGVFGGFGGRRGPKPEVRVSLSDRATPSDIAKALLHAAFLRKAVLDHFVNPLSETHHHHHHKQLHHHSHHHYHHSLHHHHHHHHQKHQHQRQEQQQQQQQHAVLESPGRQVPLNPEDFLYNHNHHNHHNHHNRRKHGHQQEVDHGKGVLDVAIERDVGDTNPHCNGYNGHNGRDHDVAGIHQLQQRRQDQMRQRAGGGNGSGPSGATACGAGGDGDGAVIGHLHDHMHWDPDHHVLYHHSHYHTHYQAQGLDHGHGHGGPMAAASRTTSLCLGHGHGQGHGSGYGSNSSDSNGAGLGVDGGGGNCGRVCCAAQSGQAGETTGCSPATTIAAAAVATRAVSEPQESHHLQAQPHGIHLKQQQQQQYPLQQKRQQQPPWHRSQPHPGRESSSCSNSSSDGGGGPAPEPRWDRLDETTWAALIQASRREAERNLPRLLGEVEQAGWKLKPFMLNTTERVQFVRL